eukprot:TRINITY_DN362_c0_g1_i1.p1 TRINITY_DN362_c0_g1~~TRINITY_DN362_c0_g1_i1.p1  ORF type:complete len:311 (-),score=82.24 TRINITY_DN362_c0_g1_i1:33-965(-)
MATPYKDLGKGAKDLITKLFPSSDKKSAGDNLGLAISSKLKAPSYVTVTSEASKHPNGETVSANAEVEFDVPEHNATLKVKFDTAQKYNVNAEFKDLVEGTKVSVGGEFTENDIVVKLSGSFKNDNVNAGVDVDYTVGSSLPILTPSLAGAYETFNGGVTAQLNFDTNEQNPSPLVSYGVAASHGDKEHVGTLFHSSDKKGVLTSGLSYFQKYNSDIDVSGDVTFTDLEFASPTVRLALSLKQDTTLFKFRLQNTGALQNLRGAFAVEEKFNHFKLQTGYDLNLLQFVGKDESAPEDLVGHQFGVKLNFE